MSDLTREFEAQFDQSCFPPALLARYEPTACLAAKDICQTYLLRHRQTGVDHIAKVYPLALFSPGESAILRALSHPGIPRVVDEFEHDGALFVVREYAPGHSLSQLAADGAPLARDAAPLLMRLCEIASYLHRQSPPVVHRDIKPSNLVLDPDGRLSLIDFEIARRYDSTSSIDTVVMFTRDYAAPEAYGYRQTDARSDIYSMGVVLLFLLTGESDVQRADELVTNPVLLAIVLKCTAFAPGERYQSADALLRALQRAQRTQPTGTGRRWLRPALAGAALCLALCAGYLLGRAGTPPIQTMVGNAPPATTPATAPLSTPVPTPMRRGTPASFVNPIVEQGVRQQLGKLDGESVYPDELTQVRELHISLGQVFATNGDVGQFNVEAYWDNPDRKLESVDIGSLEDLRMLPRLRILSLFMCTFDGVAPLADTPDLTDLDVALCTLRDPDIGALGTLENLRFLRFAQCGVRDFSAIAGLPSVNCLWLGPDRLDSYGFLDGLGPLTGLCIGNVALSEVMPHLRGLHIEHLDLHHVFADDFSALGEIEGLNQISINGDKMDTLRGLDSIPGLETLDILLSAVRDLEPLGNMRALKLLRAPRRMRPKLMALPQPLPFDVEYG